jgi:type IV pilus assembly protein PilB
MRVSDAQLATFIRDSGLVSRTDLEHAQTDAKERDISLSRILVDEGLISTDDLRRMQAYVLGIPFVSLKDKKIEMDILSLIPEPVARTHNIVGFKKSGDSLEVAMLDTDDLAAIEFIKKTTNLKILPRLTDQDSMKTVLLQYQKSLKEEFGDLLKGEAGNMTLVRERGDDMSPEELKKVAEDLPVVRIVDTLLRHAIIQQASDIHMEPMETEFLVRYRIDGVLRDAMTLPANTAASITARMKVLSNLKLDEKRLPQDGRFKIEADGERVSFRVSILPTYYGEKTVMRLLREGGGGFTLEALGFHGEGLERLHRATKQSTGMILVTGPTGSGKTTTLYTVLDLLNTPDVNISTIEDPIEYQMKRVNQTQVKPHIGFTFASGLRSLLRQDPDIIMVGEIRDGETADLAVNAALTGHLVLSTLHTNSAAGCVSRLRDMGAEAFLLTSTLKVVVGQRLVRTLCDQKEEYTLTSAEQTELGKLVDLDRVLAVLKEEKIVPQRATFSSVPFYKPITSPECEDGFSGRRGIHEVLWVTDTIKDMIMKNMTDDEIEEQAKKEGMLTMLEDGIYKAARGITTIEEVLRVVSE